MKIVVQKYGGTSVSTIERIKNVAHRIIKKKEEGFHIVVVVSAMGKNTDDLLEMAYKLSNNPPKREVDMLISTGEQVSISLLSMALNQEGCEAISLLGSQVNIKTVGNHIKSKISSIDDDILIKYLEQNKNHILK